MQTHVRYVHTYDTHICAKAPSQRTLVGTRRRRRRRRRDRERLPLGVATVAWPPSVLASLARCVLWRGSSSSFVRLFSQFPVSGIAIYSVARPSPRLSRAPSVAVARFFLSLAKKSPSPASIGRRISFRARVFFLSLCMCVDRQYRSQLSVSTQCLVPS